MEHFPNAQLEEDNDGQVIIYTDWFVQSDGKYKLGEPQEDKEG